MNIETRIICISDSICSDGKLYKAGQEYVYFKNKCYDRLYYTIYNMQRETMSTVSYDFMRDSFIEKFDLEVIDGLYQKYLNVY